MYDYYNEIRKELNRYDSQLEELSDLLQEEELSYEEYDLSCNQAETGFKTQLYIIADRAINHGISADEIYDYIYETLGYNL